MNQTVRRFAQDFLGSPCEEDPVDASAIEAIAHACPQLCELGITEAQDLDAGIPDLPTSARPPYDGDR